MKQLFTIEGLKQLLSYVCVGGVAALVEWGLFTVFANVIGLPYLLATGLAFVFSTATNLILGRIWTFRKIKTYENKRVKETVFVFAVSAIGLVFNMVLMYLFVTVIGWNSNLMKVISKVLATGIVFVWNFLIRKLFIYRERGDNNE